MLHAKIFEHKDWKHSQLSSNILSFSIKLWWQFIATIYIQTFCCHGIAFNYVFNATTEIKLKIDEVMKTQQVQVQLNYANFHVYQKFLIYFKSSKHEIISFRFLPNIQLAYIPICAKFVYRIENFNIPGKWKNINC